jgi:oxygen-independent coproporphyrinogen-3 oxidase
MLAFLVRVYKRKRGAYLEQCRANRMIGLLAQAVYPLDTSPAGLYVHVPFCRSKCTYCGFVSTVHDPEIEEIYVDAVIKEITLGQREPAWGMLHRDIAIDSVYFGGGTPSVLSLESLSRLLKGCLSSFRLAQPVEITMEINPATGSEEIFRAWRARGVNRVSLGVQSLDDRVLRHMGRSHTAEEALSAFRLLRSVGFENISVDIIVGFPGQSRNSLLRTTEKLIALQPDHLSVYLLEVKPGTPLEQRLQRGEKQAPEDDVTAEMYEDVCRLAEAAGYEQYEIANFARKGKYSRHNLKYWTDSLYVGVGPGACGMTGRQRYTNVPDIGDYCSALAGSRPPRETVEDLSAAVRFRDALIMGLRLVRGINLRELGTRYGVDAVGYVKETIWDLEAAGLFEINGDRLALTSRGRLLSNTIFCRWV